jgi:hypothetical protein
MRRKGQITLFIVIGLVLVMAIGLFIFLRVRTTEQGLQGQLSEITDVSTDFQPVYDYVDNCIKETSETGLRLLGQRGGFIYPERNGIVSGGGVTDYNGIRMAKNWVVPYWFHLSSDNKCIGDCQFSVVPDAKVFLHKTTDGVSVESQLEDYLDEKLGECLGDFEILKSQGFDIQVMGALDPTVQVLEEEVLFTVDYPIRASLGDSVEDLARYIVIEPINLNKIWEMATMITVMESEYKFLERLALNLIVAYGGLEKEIPPMYDMAFEFGSEKTWPRRLVQQRVKDIIASHVSLLKVYGTSNYVELDFPGENFKENVFNEGMTIPGDDSWSDISVNFNYLDWEPYLDLNCHNDVCKPESMSIDMLALFGIQKYNFLFDISFPTIVSLEDAQAFNNQGYLFNFLLEGNVRDNRALLTEYAPVEIDAPDTGTMVCDPDKRNSGQVEMNIKDISNNPVSDVEVSFNCGTDSCYIGSTDSKGMLISKLPICMGGLITFAKEDYLRISSPISTDLNREDTVDIEITPIITTNFIVKKGILTRGFSGVFGPVHSTFTKPLNLSLNDSALITLVRHGSIYEQPYSTAVDFFGGSSKQQIDIAPGEYQVNIDLYHVGDIVFPPETISAGDDSFTLEGRTFEGDFPNGGLYINHTFTTFNMDKGDITFIAVSPNIPGIPELDRRLSDLEQVSKLGFYSGQFGYSLQPRYGK